MAKKILAVMLLLSLTAAFACAEDTLLEKATRIAQDGETLIRMSEEDLYDIVGIEPDEYTDFAYLADMDALSGREIILLRAADEDCAQEIVAKLNEYREQRMHSTRNYLPEVFRCLSETEVLQNDLLIGLSVASANPQEINLLLQEE